MRSPEPHWAEAPDAKTATASSPASIATPIGRFIVVPPSAGSVSASGLGCRVYRYRDLTAPQLRVWAGVASGILASPEIWLSYPSGTVPFGRPARPPMSQPL